MPKEDAEIHRSNLGQTPENLYITRVWSSKSLPGGQRKAVKGLAVCFACTLFKKNGARLFARYTFAQCLMLEPLILTGPLLRACS